MYMCGTTIKSQNLSHSQTLQETQIFPKEKKEYTALNNNLFVDFLMYPEDEVIFYDAYNN